MLEINYVKFELVLISFWMYDGAVLATDEKYNEAVYSSAKRLVAAIDGQPDPGGSNRKG
jgi:hypothetical protein